MISMLKKKKITGLVEIVISLKNRKKKQSNKSKKKVKKKKKTEKTTEQNKKEKLDITYCIREAQYDCYNL